MKYPITAILVLAIAVPLAGCGGSNATGGYGGATPEAAFGNLKTAFKNKDFKTAMGQTTPETQEMMIAGFSMIAPMMAMFDPEKGADKAKDFQKILDKHGVKPPDLAKMTPGQDPKTAMKDVAAGVKDKPACIGEIMQWMETSAKGSENSSMTMKDMGNATLVDVKIDGDTATGTIKGLPNDQSETQKFKKIDGAWFLDMSDKMPGGQG
jgi:hypothetical protein